MAYQIEASTQDGRPYLEIRDVESGAVRLAWRHPAPDQALPDDPLVRALVAEDALHGLFKRLFLLAAGQRISRRGADGGRSGRPWRRLFRQELSRAGDCAAPQAAATEATPPWVSGGAGRPAARPACCSRVVLIAAFDLPAAVAIMPRLPQESVDAHATRHRICRRAGRGHRSERLRAERSAVPAVRSGRPGRFPLISLQGTPRC